MKYVIIQVKMCLAMWAASMRVRFATCCTRGSVTGTVLKKKKKIKNSVNKQEITSTK